jgi:hypothetical protein
MVFEIRKPACQLHSAFKLIIFMFREGWSLVEMERCSVQQQIVAVQLFIKILSVTAKQLGFRQQFQRRDAPSHNILLLRLSERQQKGS